MIYCAYAVTSVVRKHLKELDYPEPKTVSKLVDQVNK